MIELAPSILSADFARLGEQVRAACEGGASVIHVDVMDGHFVPNLTIGPPVVKSLRKVTELPLDCHLMIENPDAFIPAFAEAGARNVTVHAEAVSAPLRTARELHAVGARAGLAFNPGTGVEPDGELFPEFDMVLIMTIEPGFGGPAPTQHQRVLLGKGKETPFVGPGRHDEDKTGRPEAVV